MNLEEPTEPDALTLNEAENEFDDGNSGQALHRGTATEITTDHSYIYAGGKLLRETISDGTTTKTLDFTYDNVGMPYSLIYNNGTTTTYYYITNLQGDVMYLVDASGNEVAAYDYDPYGKIISATGAMAEINPLRYRGYYYDSETGFYYLQSRYYDPEICRFINADSYASTGQGFIGFNMFAYCNNNPVNFIDPFGHDAEALEWWVSTMAWLCAVDGPYPIGDIIFGLGVVVCGIDYYITISKRDTPVIVLEEDDNPPAIPDDTDDFDDDYYDNESNFAGREKIGKAKGKTPANNQAQNKQFGDATRGLSNKQKRELHDDITKKGLGYQEIFEQAQAVRNRAKNYDMPF